MPWPVEVTTWVTAFYVLCSPLLPHRWERPFSDVRYVWFYGIFLTYNLADLIFQLLTHASVVNVASSAGGVAVDLVLMWWFYRRGGGGRRRRLRRLLGAKAKAALAKLREAARELGERSPSPLPQPA